MIFAVLIYFSHDPLAQEQRSIISLKLQMIGYKIMSKRHWTLVRLKKQNNNNKKNVLNTKLNIILCGIKISNNVWQSTYLIKIVSVEIWNILCILMSWMVPE